MVALVGLVKIVVVSCQLLSAGYILKQVPRNMFHQIFCFIEFVGQHDISLSIKLLFSLSYNIFVRIASLMSTHNILGLFLEFSQCRLEYIIE